jgi:hypothetical protein
MESQVEAIHPSTVSVQWQGKPHELANDTVIVCAGGVLPTPLLQKVGIAFETKYGTA